MQDLESTGNEISTIEWEYDVELLFSKLVVSKKPWQWTSNITTLFDPDLVNDIFDVNGNFEGDFENVFFT